MCGTITPTTDASSARASVLQDAGQSGAAARRREPRQTYLIQAVDLFGRVDDLVAARAKLRHGGKLCPGAAWVCARAGNRWGLVARSRGAHARVAVSVQKRPAPRDRRRARGFCTRAPPFFLRVHRLFPTCPPLRASRPRRSAAALPTAPFCPLLQRLPHTHARSLRRSLRGAGGGSRCCLSLPNRPSRGKKNLAARDCQAALTCDGRDASDRAVAVS